MTKLIALKNKIVRFCENYETYVNLVWKFIVAFALFTVINRGLGYMSALLSVPVVLLLSVLCAVLPFGMTMFLGSVLVILHVYALSIEAAVVTLLLFLLIYLLYFRFAPGEGQAAVLMPILLGCRIPYIVPVGCGLLRKASSAISVLCGTIVYYYLLGIRQNEAAFTLLAESEEEDVTSEVFSRFRIAIAQITNNRELYLATGIFLAVTLLVYLIRRLSIDHAWTIAIISGLIVEFGGMAAGYALLNISGKYLTLLIGCLISALLAVLVEFFFMDLDYTRTERVQFEDDEYYYHVKAIPKMQVAAEERTVKRFGAGAQDEEAQDDGEERHPGREKEKPKNKKGRKQPEQKSGSREDEDENRVIAQELDIDEDLL